MLMLSKILGQRKVVMNTCEMYSFKDCNEESFKDNVESIPSWMGESGLRVRVMQPIRALSVPCSMSVLFCTVSAWGRL